MARKSKIIRMSEELLEFTENIEERIKKIAEKERQKQLELEMIQQEKIMKYFSKKTQEQIKKIVVKSEYNSDKKRNVQHYFVTFKDETIVDATSIKDLKEKVKCHTTTTTEKQKD